MTRKQQIILVMSGLILAFIGFLFYYGSQPAVSESDYKEQAASFAYDRYLLDYVEEGEFVKETGEVFAFDQHTIEPGEAFILFTEEGAFHVMNSSEHSIREGEIVTVYGGYVGKDHEGSPAINAHYIDR